MFRFGEFTAHIRDELRSLTEIRSFFSAGRLKTEFKAVRVYLLCTNAFSSRTEPARRADTHDGEVERKRAGKMVIRPTTQTPLDH